MRRNRTCFVKIQASPIPQANVEKTNKQKIQSETQFKRSPYPMVEKVTEGTNQNDNDEHTLTKDYYVLKCC